MSVAFVLIGILGVAILMVVHEAGHYFAARRFGMRVTKFSIGFGPTIVKHRPKGSPTTFQVAIIPFLAYVQIAGMNPYEEIDPKDEGSYANASLWARTVTIAAGPLANYLVASVFMFFAFMIGGVVESNGMHVQVTPEGPAAVSGIRDGDKILSIDGQSIEDWDQLKAKVGGSPGKAIDVEVERGAERLHFAPVPYGDGERKGMIMLRNEVRVVNVGVARAAKLSVTEPALFVYDTLKLLGRVIARREKPELRGPVGIVKDMAGAARDGAGSYLRFLGFLSAYLGAFNLLPFPALDGGRLLFLGFEAASRRRADAKVEANVHAIGLLMFLALLAVVTYNEVVPRGKPDAAEVAPK